MEIEKMSDEELLKELINNTVNLNPEEHRKCYKELLSRLSNNKTHKTINFYSPQEIEDIKKQTIEEYKKKLVEDINKIDKKHESSNEMFRIEVLNLINEL